MGVLVAGSMIHTALLVLANVGIYKGVMVLRTMARKQGLDV